MEQMTFQFPFTDPVAIRIEIRWYGLAYMAGLSLGWLYMRHLCSNARIWDGTSPMTPDQADDFLLWATAGTVIGGRLGYFILYDPAALAAHPLQILRIWEGGMAFHGGLLGVGLAIFLFARRNAIPVRSLMDLSAAAVPFGLFFGRIANFINGELYGRLSNIPWAVDFPTAALLGDATGPRHPTQIYEALLEGAVMFAIIRSLTHRRLAFLSPGLTTGAFLIAYSAFRILVEFFREWDFTEPFTTAYISSGMVYCMPMIALGIYYLATARLARTGSVAPVEA